MDAQLKELIKEETDALNSNLILIASENYPSAEILDVMGSVLSVPYTEGYPIEVSKQGRHYAGCEVIDKSENFAILKACELFNCKYANVQPWSGSQANLAVYAGLLKPGDHVLGMDISAGGHLTHFSKASDTSKEYVAEYYGLDENGILNYQEIEDKLYKHNPRLLVVGASAYSRIINFERIRKTVDKYNNTIKNWISFFNSKFEASGSFGSTTEDTVVQDCDGIKIVTKIINGKFDSEKCYEDNKCYLMVDMAHIAGLVAANLHPSPLPYADVVTTTTHKTLRGPRGGMILWNDDKLCSKLNNGVFPRTQGGSNQATIAAKAKCFIEALQPSFKKYANQILVNMQALIKGIKEEDSENKIGFVSGGSENHLILLDIKKVGISGKIAEDRLTSYHVVCNKNMINDDIKPADCTGIRLGTAAITTRGFTEDMCFELGKLIAKIILMPEKTENGTVDLESISIKVKLQKMLDKVGPFYKTEDNVTYSPDSIA